MNLKENISEKNNCENYNKNVNPITNRSGWSNDNNNESQILHGPPQIGRVAESGNPYMSMLHRR